MTLNSYFTIPNQKEIFELSGSELKILTALRAVTYQNKEFLILSEKAKQEILKLLSKTYSAFKPIQRIISRLVTKGIILLKKSGIYSKVLFQHHKSAKVAPPYISKEEYSKEATSPIGLQREQTEIHSFYIQSNQPEERKNPDLISDDLSPVESTKGINAYPEQQPTLISEINAIKIDNSYLKALKQQMLKYGYSNQDIELTEKLIYRAKNKGVAASRIQDTAKAIIFNKIQKSAKKKEIRDIKGFIISALFSKQEPFIFQKISDNCNFPFEVFTGEDIKISDQKQKQNEVLKLQELSRNRVQQEQQAYENMENALKDKLNDKYENEFIKTKQNIIKQTGNQFIPWPTVITSLYNIVFNADMTV